MACSCQLTSTPKIIATALAVHPNKMLAVLSNKHARKMHLATLKQVIAGADMFITSHATIPQHVASQMQFLVKNNAAEWYQNTTKSKNAAMFHNTTVKQLAAWNQNTTAYQIANMFKDKFVTNTADMYQDTIGNIHAVITAAKHLAQQQALFQLTAANNLGLVIF